MIGFPRRADAMKSIEIAGVAYRHRDLRAASKPSFALTSKSRSWSRITSAGERLRVSLAEACVLQTFPPDYPFQATRTRNFLHLSNAIPPRLAHAILKQVA